MADESSSDLSLHEEHLGKPCDLCGESCEANQELNLLGCSYPACQLLACCYHQDCLERYLKSIRCERNRKTGFKCPRGCGKKTQFDQPCPGKVDKSHPIHPRAEATKRRKKAAPPPPPPPPPPKVKPAAKAESKAPVASSTLAAKQALPGKPALPVACAKQPVAPPKPAPAPLVPAKPAAAKSSGNGMSREALAAAAASARRELGLGGMQNGGSSSGGSSGGSSRAAAQSAVAVSVESAQHYYAPPVQPLARVPSGGLSMHDFLPQFAHAPAAAEQPAAAVAAPAPSAASGPAAWGSRGPPSAWGPAPAPAPAQSTPGPDPGWQAAPQPPLPSWGPSAGSSIAGPALGGSLGGAGGDEAFGDEDGEGEQSQRKSKRERKRLLAAAAQAAAQHALPPPPPPPPPPALPQQPSSSSLAMPWQVGSAPLEQRVAGLLAARKAQLLARQLGHLGFPAHLCAMAVRRHGCDLEGAASWLLEAGPGWERGQLAEAEQHPPAEMPLLEEAQQLEDLCRLGFARPRVLQAVLEAGGDCEAAVLLLFQPQPLQPQPQQAAAWPPQQPAPRARPPPPGWAPPEQPCTPPQEAVAEQHSSAMQNALPRPGDAFASAAAAAAAAPPLQLRQESRFSSAFSGSGYGADAAEAAEAPRLFSPLGGFSAAQQPQPQPQPPSLGSAGGLFSRSASFGGGGAAAGGLGGFLSSLSGGREGGAGDAAQPYGALGFGLSAFANQQPQAAAPFRGGGDQGAAGRAPPPGFGAGGAGTAVGGRGGLWGAPQPLSRPRTSRLAGYGISADEQQGGEAPPQEDAALSSLLSSLICGT